MGNMLPMIWNYVFLAKPSGEPLMNRRYMLLWKEEMQLPPAQDEWNHFSLGETGVLDILHKGHCRNWSCRESAGSKDARGLSGVCWHSGWLHSILSKGVSSIIPFIEPVFIPTLKPKGLYLYKTIIRNPLIHTTQTITFHILWDDQTNWALWSCFLSPETCSFMDIDLGRGNNCLIVEYVFQKTRSL